MSLGTASVVVLLLALAAGFRWPGIMVAGCLFTYQVGAVSGLGWIGSAYVAGAAAIALGRFAMQPRPLQLTVADVLLAVLLVYLAITTSWAPRLDRALTMLGQLALSIGGMYVVGRFQTEEPGRFFRQMVLGTTVMGAVLCMMMLGARVTQNAHEATRLYLANEDATTVGISMPLPFAMLGAVSAIFLAPRRWMSLLGILALGVVAYVSVISATRSVFVALAAGMAATLLLALPHVGFKRFALALLVALMGVVVLIASLPEESVNNLVKRFGGSQGKQLGTDSSSMERLRLWSDSYEMIDRHPILGTGFGSFGDFSTAPYPHNVELEVASTAGMIGLVLLLAWLLALLAGLWRGYRRDALSGAFLIGFATAAVMQLQVSYALFMARPLFLAGALAPLLLAAGRAGAPRRARRPAARPPGPPGEPLGGAAS